MVQLMYSYEIISTNTGKAFSVSAPSQITSGEKKVTMKKCSSHTDQKENQIFLIYKEIQSGAVAKSYKRKGFLICEEMRKYFPIYEKAVSHS